MVETARVGFDSMNPGAGELITCRHCGFTLGSERVWKRDGDETFYTLSYGMFREYNGVVFQPESA